LSLERRVNWYLGFIAVGVWLGAAMLYAGRRILKGWKRKPTGKPQPKG
jgi:hypothetical protein